MIKHSKPSKTIRKNKQSSLKLATQEDAIKANLVERKKIKE